jgi:hypothetical protein
MTSDKIALWYHHCHIEEDIMGMEKGKECNWCGLKEKDNMYPVYEEDNRTND